MKKTLISVLIPIYNVEHYLRECIDSILNQTYQDLEILLINDGSTDKCEDICHLYVTKDSRVKYYYKENGGLSDTRNYGIIQASGEYLMFVDPDDWLEPDAIQILYDKMIEYEADISIANYHEYMEENSNFIFNILDKDYYERRYSTSEILNEFSKRIEVDVSLVVVWGKLYKAKLFQNVRFRVGSYTEDEAIIYRLYQQSKSIIYMNKGLYWYRRRQGTLSKHRSQKFIEDTLKNYEERIAILAITHGDISSLLPYYRKILLGFEREMREIMGMKDTELYRRIKENIYLIDRYTK